MITNARSEIVEGLDELGRLWPEMRFGQLLCTVSSLAGERESGLPQDMSDTELVIALRSRIEMSNRRRSGERSAMPDDSTRSRALQLIDELSDRYPQWPVGRLVFYLAATAHANIYDVEDEQLLAAGHEQPGIQWFERYTESLEAGSIIRERRSQPSYRCPCCHCLTLYARGEFEICPVCYWEDDGQDDSDADLVRGGPNRGRSLTQARENYASHGVSDPEFRLHVRPPRDEEVLRDVPADGLSDCL